MTWERIEGSSVDPQVTEGISARVADPLWLLARQWQVGEFRGEDASSPVLVEASVAAVPVTGYWVERGTRRHTVPRGDSAWPLETLVEHEPIAAGPAEARIRLEAGAELLRLLAGAGAPADVLAAFREAYRFNRAQLDDDLDAVGHARLALLARRALDARRVVTALDDAGGDASQLAELAALDEAVRTRLAAAVTDWNTAEATIFCDVAPGTLSAWRTPRLEYDFGVSAETADGIVELAAPEYPGGRLDWYHFEVRSAPKPVPGGEDKPVPGMERKALSVLATPLQFAGMPASRWWEFEDHDVDFGDLAGGPDDLARSVVAAYAMVAGDDWWVVPCTLNAGSLARVNSLRVLDDFGQPTSIPATAVRDYQTGARPWRFFELSGDPAPENEQAPMLFLPPVLATVEQSRPLEAVAFRRDEMANLAWAIEHRVESQAGRPVDREAGGTDSEVVPVEGDDWRYRLSTDVPDHWVPLVPVRINGESPQIALRRGRIALETDLQPAKGRILEPEHAFVMHEEEIPTGGIRVTRRYQIARGADGTVRAWVGRHKAPAGGPMRRTPLRFDSLTGWTRSR